MSETAEFDVFEKFLLAIVTIFGAGTMVNVVKIAHLAAHHN